jgi:hypothetical protein
MKLLLSQKNEIYDYIENYGLSPNLFEIIDAASMEAGNTIIKLKNSSFYCRLSMHKDKHIVFVTYSPASELYEKTDYIDTAWSSLFSTIKTWISCIQREISQIDKWIRLKEEISYINLSKEEENNKFTALEYQELKTKMIQLKVEIKTIGLTEIQYNSLESKIDLLIEKATHLGKFDWKSIL